MTEIKKKRKKMIHRCSDECDVVVREARRALVCKESW